MEKYIKIDWPEIQEYMDDPNYPEEFYFDPDKNAWFVSEDSSLGNYSGYVITDDIIIL